ncbi:MAG: ABC transporter ATP-binding protein [Acidobacteriia bacterium]|nr:ABC transporter ATP-binding protein [Terriglobia bacterium]
MSSTVIQVDRLSKHYRLGQIGGKRLVDDVSRWWAKLRGQEDPLSKVGQAALGGRGKREESREGKNLTSSLSPLRSSGEAPLSPLSPLRSSTSETLWALRDVSFEVKQGEVLGIIGRNGAGKSTLLKILSRVTAPTSGEVRVKGRIASLLEVGTGFHPELTGRENIFLNGAILGMTKAEIRSKFDEIVAFSEVEQFIDTPVKRYSSGMTVRLAFAVAAHLEPEILIVDEVLAVGDAAFQKKCLGKMKDVAGAGRTVLFVSHNMAAITTLCTRTLVIHRGTLRLDADSAVAVRDYLGLSGPSRAEVRWNDNEEAPGDELLRLRAIRVLDHDGYASVYHQSSSPIRVQFEFDLHQVEPALHIGFDLLSADGVKVLRSFHNDRLSEAASSMRLGRNVINCELPPNFLNAGTYLVSPTIGIHMVRWIVSVESIVQFDVEFTHGESKFVNNPERRKHGVIAPVLIWNSSAD